MSKNATMKDIAKTMGLSINAVSLALNGRKGVSEATRIKVMETAREMGYLDGTLRYIEVFGQHHICVLIQDIYKKEYMTTAFYGRILYSIIKEAKNRRYEILIRYFNEQDMNVPDCIVKRRIAGILVLGKISTRNVEKFLALNIHTVFVDHNPRLPNANCILTDNISGGYMAAEYLIRNGFARIGYIGDLSYSKSIKERYYGFLEALVNEGLVKFGETDEYIRKYSLITEIGFCLVNNNVDAIKEMLPAKPLLPQAYFCNNDTTAVIVMKALRKKGINIPEDISIIGFDNDVSAETCSPGLTSINVNRELMGQKAVWRLVQLINNENPEAEHTVMAVELVKRDSVKPAGGTRI
jgi:DNA-binding LacI/PurR family transcriptional regulator